MDGVSDRWPKLAIELLEDLGTQVLRDRKREERKTSVTSGSGKHGD